MSTGNTIAQERALYAYDSVKSIAGQGFAKAFKSHVKEIPMLIKTNGLNAAFAFFSSKKTEDYKKITELTFTWLKDERKLIEATEGQELYEVLLHLDSLKQRMAIREINALFTWLKRYADAMIGDV